MMTYWLLGYGLFLCIGYVFFNMVAEKDIQPHSWF